METNNIEVVALLNKALADEWLAYYQYWIGAHVIEGENKEAVIAELVEHANDELRHADMLVKRIIELGGKPILEPKEWYDQTNCGYAAPTDPEIKKILEQNINGERCAIEVYKKLISITKDKDEVTHKMSVEILDDEVEHEEDLSTLLTDFLAKQ